MTWVFGWPLYFDDAVEISKKHNLVNEPVVNEHAYIDAAQRWVARNAGFPLVFACWVNDELHYAFALYVDYRDRAYPPGVIFSDDVMPTKQRHRLRESMHGEAWTTTDFSRKDNLAAILDGDSPQGTGDSDEDINELDEGESDDDIDDSGDKGDSDEDPGADTSSDDYEDDEDSTGSDGATVTDGAVSVLDLPAER